LRNRRGRLIFKAIISNRQSAAWVEGQQDTRKSVATINHDVLPRTPARLLVKKLAGDPATDYTGVDPMLGCDKKEELKNLLQPGVLVLLSIDTSNVFIQGGSTAKYSSTSISNPSHHLRLM
jgi:hypothetical protein